MDQRKMQAIIQVSDPAGCGMEVVTLEVGTTSSHTQARSDGFRKLTECETFSTVGCSSAKGLGPRHTMGTDRQIEWYSHLKGHKNSTILESSSLCNSDIYSGTGDKFQLLLYFTTE